nr:N-carbamoyl-D-amino-acid hydrolase [Alphaproteobacteria bacterium]
MTKSDRILTVGAAQLGPIGLNESRPQVVDRLLSLLDKAHDRDCDLVVYPELALTTFFPRWYFEEKEQIGQYFESAMPSNETQPLFDRAAEYGIGFCLGFAERAGGKYFNTCILVDKSGTIVGKYRKVHLPGHSDHKPERKWQHLEKAYFDVGDLGFPVWRTMGGIMGMCICNDRRWPETYRMMGLQGVEM